MNYISSEWGFKPAEKFIKRLEHFNILIQFQPHLFAIYHKSKNIRKHVLYRKNLVLYKITKHEVFIIAVLDGRINPKEVKKIVRQRTK